MNNLVYSYDFIIEVESRIKDHIRKDGRIFYSEDIIDMLLDSNKVFDAQAVREDAKATRENAEETRKDAQKTHKDIPSADDLKDNGKFEKIAEVHHFSIEAPKNDDIASQAKAGSDADDIADHIKAASDEAKICKRCGKPFIPANSRQRICPECRKDRNAGQYANKVAKEVDDLESVARDILSMGDDNEG